MSDKAREKIAGLMTKRETEFGRPMTPIEIADGLIAALPDIIADMVPDLVWDGTVAKSPWPTYTYQINDTDSADEFIESAKAHNRSTILKALGIKEGE